MKYERAIGKKYAPHTGIVIKNSPIIGGIISSALRDLIGYLVNSLSSVVCIIRVQKPSENYARFEPQEYYREFPWS
jgi:hypothetical protein